MNTIPRKLIIPILILAILSAGLLLFQLDKIALTDPDETFYAQTAKEMVRKGEWLTPILYGEPQFEKPILFYWFVEISYKMFGINEFAARLPSAIFGLIGLIAMYLLGKILFSARTGLFSAIALATNIEYIILSGACVTDMALFTFMLLGVSFFFYGQIRKKDHFYILSAVAFAFAALTKGPIGLLLPGFIIFVYLLAAKDFSTLKKFKVIFQASLIFILIALPWYIIMYKLHAKAFVDEFFGFHNITRFLTPEHKIGSQVYYNIPIVLGGFLPWSAFLPLGFWHIFKSKEKKAALFILLWFFIIFIFFSVSSTKLPTYIFPCFISLALIVGKLWDDFIKKHNEKNFLITMRLSYYFLLSTIVLGMIGGYIFIKTDYPDMVNGALITGAFLIFGLTLSLITFVLKKFIAAFFLIAYSILLPLYPLTMLVLPRLEAYETSKTVSNAIMSRYKEGDILGCERDFRAGVAFYTDKIPVMLDSNQTLSDLLRSDKKVFGVVKQRNMVDEAHVLYKWGKKRLVTNKVRQIEQ